MAVTEREITHELTDSEGRQLFDDVAREYLGISGAEFIQAWDAGQFDADADGPAVMRVAMLLPLGR